MHNIPVFTNCGERAACDSQSIFRREQGLVQLSATAGSAGYHKHGEGFAVGERGGDVVATMLPSVVVANQTRFIAGDVRLVSFDPGGAPSVDETETTSSWQVAVVA